MFPFHTHTQQYTQTHTHTHTHTHTFTYTERERKMYTVTNPPEHCASQSAKDLLKSTKNTPEQSPTFFSSTINVVFGQLFFSWMSLVYLGKFYQRPKDYILVFNVCFSGIQLLMEY